MSQDVEDMKFFDWKMKACVVAVVCTISLLILYVWTDDVDGEIVVIQDQYLGYETVANFTSTAFYVELENCSDDSRYGYQYDGALRFTDDWNIDLLEPGAEYRFTLENRPIKGVVFDRYAGCCYRIIDVEFISPSPWRS